MALTATKVALLGLVLVAMTATVAMAAVPQTYVVSWTLPTSNIYYRETQGRIYSVGDKLKFMYARGMHNVVKVRSVVDFTGCTTLSAIGPRYTDGHTIIALDRPGAHYFICSLPEHCAGGMKIKVLVKA